MNYNLKQECLIIARLTLLLGVVFFSFAWAQDDSLTESDSDIERLTALIEKTPGDSKLYIQRGDVYLDQQEFFDAVEDYTIAIELDPEADRAFLGRGMAQSRQGMIREGIKDLSVYITRNPSSSLAYTKRGVRYMWIEDFVNAKKDLIKAIELDPGNAEAHDDLGVIYAKRKDYQKALEHFSTTINIDPSYQKGYHNLAMTLYLAGQDTQALLRVNQALALNSNHKDAVLLKSLILKELGRYEEAAIAKEKADFLPETNWSEGVSVQ